MSQLIGTVTHYEARFIHGWMPFPSEWWAVMDEEGSEVIADTYDDCLTAAMEVIEPDQVENLVIAQVDTKYFRPVSNVP